MHEGQKKSVAYGGHPDRLDEAVQVRLIDRFAVKEPSSFEDVEHINVIF